MYNIKELMDFLDGSLTSYHAVENMKTMLEKAGFEGIGENELWKLERGKAYYCIRNASSLIAFRIPDNETGNIKGFHVYAAHSDSPAFKVKDIPELTKEGIYACLNVEKYGSMILSTWFDRPLGIAGRVCVDKDGEITSYAVRLKDNFCVIPNVAIHLNREVNEGTSYNVQNDMIPLVSTGVCADDAHTFTALLAKELSRQTGEKYDADDILAYDMYAVNSQKAVLAGENDEFIMSARYDDLGCVYAGLKGILDAKPQEYIDIFAVFDNEEVGSLTRQGADSTFFKDTLENIADALGVSDAVYRIWKSGSFMLSADNAHACHPNYASKYDPVNRPYINKGIVLKHHGGQKYATDAYSAAYFRRHCRKNDIPVQDYANHSNIAGGSTLGNISMAQVSMPAADIGLAQLAMHSAYETAGVKDMEYMLKLTSTFFAL